MWTTLGVPVLIDPGTFSYDPGLYNTYQISPIAHDVQLVSGKVSNPTSTMRMVGTTTSGAVHAYTVTDVQYGPAHTRNWRIDTDLHRVTVTDTIAAAATTTLHLDLSWNATYLSGDRRTMTLKHPATGRIATVVSSSPMTIYRQNTRPPLGWQFPVYGQRTGAVQVLMSAPAGTSSMIVTVS